MESWCNSNQVNLDQKETNIVRFFSRNPANSCPLLKLGGNFYIQHLMLNT